MPVELRDRAVGLLVQVDVPVGADPDVGPHR